MRPSCLRRKAIIWSMAVVSPAAHASMAHAQTTSFRDLQLEVYINGIDTERVGSFRQKGKSIFATAEELRSLGIVPPVGVAPEGLVDLAKVLIEPPALDERAQSISLRVPISALTAHRVGEDLIVGQSPISSPTGLLVNYDITATAHRGSVDADGLATARLFGGFGTLQSDFNVTHFRSQVRAVRLNTTYSYSDPVTLRTYAVGDVLSGALPYSRSLRIGGFQLSTNFALRPDLVTYPVPAISGGAAVPSTVDVLVNGVRQLSTHVDAGPFYVPQLPIVSGAGQVSVAVRDAAGHQTVRTSSFYLSSALLKPGLSSYSLEAGPLRNGFGLNDGNYGPFVMSATGRHGVTSHLTIEGHAEGSGKLSLATGGATLSLGTLAIVTSALGMSNSPNGTGSQVYLAIERTARSYHIGLSTLTTSRQFRDLGALVGDLSPRRIIQANVGAFSRRYGSFGVAYTDIVQHPSKSLRDPDMIDIHQPLRTSIASATYSREVLRGAYLRLTGYSNLRTHDRAISAGVSFHFGRQGSVIAAYDSAEHQVAIDANRPAINPGDIGWRAYATQGSNSRALGELNYRGSQAELSLGVDTYRGETAVQAAARGSIVAMSGTVFAATTITDGFAVVDTRGFGNVAVSLNNRPVGRTSKDGKLLVPGVASYQTNTVSIDPGDLPLDTRLDRLDAKITTSDRAGTVAYFNVRRQHEVLMTIILANGTPLPVGSRISLDDSSEISTSGYDGQAYFSNLVGRHNLRITLPDGGQCQANAVALSDNTWPAMAKVVCT
jgi:outer membrane usher protein